MTRRPPTDAARDPTASALGEAAEGVVELARWFTGLVGNQLVDVARAVDRRTFDADAAAAALARAATLPLLGWAALANELLDAGAVLSGPLWQDRRITSSTFRAPGVGRRRLRLDGRLTNGFEVPLPEDVRLEPEVLATDQAEFQLCVPAVPPDRVGVFDGAVTVEFLDRDPATRAIPPPVQVRAWLVVP
ncbi:MAG: hypothetical protein ACRD2C_12830 [Acidimicrobiales bacterium]